MQVGKVSCGKDHAGGAALMRGGSFADLVHKVAEGIGDGSFNAYIHSGSCLLDGKGPIVILTVFVDQVLVLGIKCAVEPGVLIVRAPAIGEGLRTCTQRNRTGYRKCHKQNQDAFFQVAHTKFLLGLDLYSIFTQKQFPKPYYIVDFDSLQAP